MTYISEKIRQAVTERSQGHCEYCKLPIEYAYYQHEIDHIYAEKHGGKTELDNLCLACADCNRHKSSNLCSLDPLTGNIIALYHPRQHQWQDHFNLNSYGIIETKSAIGRVTEKVLMFNRLELVAERERLVKLGVYL